MSAQVDDFSTWRDMTRARPGGFRPAQEPLSEATWALCTSPWALQTDLGYRSFSGRFWNAFGPLREALEVQKHFKIPCFCCISRRATDNGQIVQISPWGSQNDPLPGAARGAPGGPQDGSKSATSVPRAQQEPPKASERPRRPEASRRPFWTPSGPVLHPPGIDFHTIFFSRKA